MNNIFVKIANINLKILSRYTVVALIYKDFLVNTNELENDALTIEISDDEIVREFELHKEKKEPKLTDYHKPYYESCAIFRKIAEKVIEHNVFLMHGSVIAVDGKAYMFTAPSGTGKSTHTALWREKFGERCYMVNDDKPLIRIEDGKVYACGNPWNGKHKLGTNAIVPLAGICYLERAEDNSIEKLKPIKAYPIVKRQIFSPEDPELMIKTLDLIEQMLSVVPVYKMKMNNFKDDAVDVSYNCMSKESNI